jgi:hypothetical protein
MKCISQTSSVEIKQLNVLSFFLVRVFFFISTEIDGEDVLYKDKEYYNIIRR